MKEIKTLTLTFAIILCFTFISFAQLAESPWPMFKHDARHSGQSP